MVISENTGLGHVGLVVDDTLKCVETFERDYGIKDFIVYDFKPLSAKAYGKEVPDCKLKIALGTFANGVKLEIIQVIAGDTPLKRFYERNGFGVNHINFYTEDLDKTLAYYREKGYDIIFEAEIEDDRGYRRTIYVEDPALGCIVEFSEQPHKR